MIKFFNAKKIIDEINDSKVVCLKSDTVWGLFESIKKIHTKTTISKLKNRSNLKKLSISFSDFQSAKKYCLSSKSLDSKIDLLLPGRVTLLLKPTEFAINKLGYMKNDLIGIRVPKKKNLRKIIIETGPLYNSSANISNTKYKDNFFYINSLFKETKVFLEIKNVIFFFIKRKPSRILVYDYDKETFKELKRK